MTAGEFHKTKINASEIYEQVLAAKIKVAQRHGIQLKAEQLHPSLRPDQKDIVLWMLELGAGLCAIDAGGGKTRIGIEVMRVLIDCFGGKCLIVTELGATETFTHQDPAIGEGAAMGIALEYVTEQQQALKSACQIVVTNYERVRMNSFDFRQFTAVWLDEGNYLKNMASKTTDALKQQLSGVKWKFIATATPSPNEDLELVNYAHCLGVADRGQILTEFFKRNSTKAGELTVKEEYQMLEQHRESFWLWVSSWCICITSPADLGYQYEGFILPKLNLHWVEVSIEAAIDAGKEKDGQARMFIQSRSGLSEASKIAKASIPQRVAKAKQIADLFPDDHYILWHYLEDERKALNKAFASADSYGDMFGSQKWEDRERRIIDFTKGDLQYLATKPSISGVGCNFQKHCNKAIFVGIDDSFNDIYQALKRVYRYYNPSAEVDVWFIYTPEQYEIVQNIKRKWAQHDTMRTKMREIYQLHGLDQTKQIEQRRRTFQNERYEYKGDNYTLVNTDAVLEWKTLSDNRFGMILSSFPFGNHYEYSGKYNDFGHNGTNADFFRQMDFLIPELYRTLKPGRIAAIHLKNRIHYGSVTGKGFSIFHRFTHAACDAMEKHGFETIGFHYVPTDVVAENNQTYRLGFSEMQKDSTKMGSGIPEEIWLFRKPPTSTANAYADVPVSHNVACPLCGNLNSANKFLKEGRAMLQCPHKDCHQFFLLEDLVTNSEYQITIGAWQIDADSFWKSSGNRYLNPDELRTLNPKQIRKWWNKFNGETIYDYEEHVKLLDLLESKGQLSREYTTLPLRSNSSYVWNDVKRMHGLNQSQSLRKKEKHICPMPFDEVDRLLELYSNEGDEVADPFGGIGTTGVRAIIKRRKAFLTELNDQYASTGNMYMREQEQKKKIPTLFDLMKES